MRLSRGPLGLPMGVPRRAPCRDLIVKPEPFQQFLGTGKNAGRDQAGQQAGQQGVYHMGVWAPPKLLAEAKSDENDRTKAESVGSNTPWAYRPGEFRNIVS